MSDKPHSNKRTSTFGEPGSEDSSGSVWQPSPSAVSPVREAIVTDNWADIEESVLVAQVLIDQYGSEAPFKAEASASKLLLDWADLDAWAYWKRAGRAAKQLLQTEPSGPLH
jgi:hypothetical protein